MSKYQILGYLHICPDHISYLGKVADDLVLLLQDGTEIDNPDVKYLFYAALYFLEVKYDNVKCNSYVTKLFQHVDIHDPVRVLQHCDKFSIKTRKILAEWLVRRYFENPENMNQYKQTMKYLVKLRIHNKIYKCAMHFQDIHSKNYCTGYKCRQIIVEALVKRGVTMENSGCGNCTEYAVLQHIAIGNVDMALQLYKKINRCGMFFKTSVINEILNSQTDVAQKTGLIFQLTIHDSDILQAFINSRVDDLQEKTVIATKLFSQIDVNKNRVVV